MQTTPWHNYALITYLAGKEDIRLGKTKLQKLIYFLKTLKKVPVDYNYRFYTYGPYCDELAGDVDYLTAVKAVDTAIDSSGFGYAIREGQNSGFLKNKAKDFLERYRKDIEDVVEKFSAKNAREMELLSTIYYLTYNEEDCRTNRKHLLQRTHELKPQFRTPEIESGIDELLSFGYMEHANFAASGNTAAPIPEAGTSNTL